MKYERYYPSTLMRPMNREELIDWLCWNDPNGVYRDMDCYRKGIDFLTYEEALELYIKQSEG